MISANLIKIIPQGNELGEGVQWHQNHQAFWWTDIQGAMLYRYCPNAHQLTEYIMPERVASFAFIMNSQQMIIAFASGIALYDLQLGVQRWLVKPEQGKPNNRFNDGRVDRQGHFLAGTMVENAKGVMPDAALYRLDKLSTSTEISAKYSCILNDLTIANGLCWSLDGKTLYHADSPLGTIRQFDYCIETGTISNERLFAKTDMGSFPDGATIDAAGYMWSAHWGGGRIVRYCPDGHVDFVLKLPVSQPTCIAFGGKDLNILAITSAKEGLSEKDLAEQPLAGDVFLYQLSGVTGVAESHCRY